MDTASATTPTSSPDVPRAYVALIVMLRERYHRAYDDEAERLVALAARLCAEAPATLDRDAAPLRVVGFLVLLRRTLAQRVAYAESMVYARLDDVDGPTRLQAHVDAAAVLGTLLKSTRSSLDALPASVALKHALLDGLRNFAQLVDDAVLLEQRILRARAAQ
jgi:iron-sulfur cluster repair protein YtfE (RIC family)